MPTKRHQAIAGFLYAALRTLMQQIGGAVFFSGLELQITPDKYRLPDILLLRDAVDPRGAGDPGWAGSGRGGVSPDTRNGTPGPSALTMPRWASWNTGS